MPRTRQQRSAASRYGWRPRKAAKQSDCGFVIRQLIYRDRGAVTPHFSEKRVEQALEGILANYQPGSREHELIRRTACRVPAFRVYVGRLGPAFLAAQIAAAQKDKGPSP